MSGPDAAAAAREAAVAVAVRFGRGPGPGASSGSVGRYSGRRRAWVACSNPWASLISVGSL